MFELSGVLVRHDSQPVQRLFCHFRHGWFESCVERYRSTQLNSLHASDLIPWGFLRDALVNQRENLATGGEAG